MKPTRLLLLTFFFIGIVQVGCNKEDVNCSNEAEFCTLINSEEYIETGDYIDKYLSGLKTNLSDEDKLLKLKEWLECKSCVENVEISCIACIETNPPKSALTISFNLNDNQTIKTLFIIMDNPLRFGHYQETNY